LPRRAQTFGLRFAFLDETETEKQETKAREVKNERNKGVTHDNNGLHDVRRSGFSFQRHVNNISQSQDERAEAP